MTAFRQVDDDVRPRAAILGRHRHLRVELRTAAQAAVFQDPLQHQLAPHPLRALVALERAGEVVGVVGDLLVQALQFADSGGTG